MATIRELGILIRSSLDGTGFVQADAAISSTGAATAALAAPMRAVQAQSVKTGASMSAAFTAAGAAARKAGVAVAGFAEKNKLALAGLAAVSAITLAGPISAAAKFEAELSRLKAIGGVTGDALTKLKEQSLDLGRTTVFTAVQVAEAQVNLAKAGFTANEIFLAMPGILDEAAASGEDLASVSEITTGILRGFGIEVSKTTHLTDVLTLAANSTKANIIELGESFKFAAPAATQLKIPIESATAALSLMANASVEGTLAGTAFSAGLVRLASGTKEVEDKLSELNIRIFNSKGQLRSLPDVVRALSNGLTDLSDKQRLATLMMLVGQRAQKGFNALMGQGADALAELTRQLIESDGAAHKAAVTMQDNLKGAFKRLTSAVEGAQIALGSPLLKPLQKFVDGLAGSVVVVTKFLKSLGPVGDAILQVSGAGITAVGTLSLLSLGALGVSKALPFLKDGLVLVRGAITGVGKAMLFLATNPIALATTAVVGVGLALADLFRGLSTGKSVVADAIASIANFFGVNLKGKDVLDGVRVAVDAVGEVMKGVGGVVSKATAGIAGFIFGVNTGAAGIRFGIDTVRKATSILLSSLLQTEEAKNVIASLGGVFAGLSGVVSSVGAAFGVAFENAREAVKPLVPVVEGVGAALLAVGRFVVGSVGVAFKNTFNAIGGVVQNVGRVIAGVTEVIAGVASIIANAFKAVFSLAAGNIDGVKQAFGEIGGAVVRVFDGVVDVVAGALGAIGNVYGGVFAVLTSPFQLALDWINDKFNLGKVLGDVIDKAIDFIKGPMDAISSFIMGFFPSSPAKHGPLTSLSGVGAGMVKQISDSLAGAKGALGKAFDDALPNLTQNVGMNVKTPALPRVKALLDMAMPTLPKVKALLDVAMPSMGALQLAGVPSGGGGALMGGPRPIQLNINNSRTFHIAQVDAENVDRVLNDIEQQEAVAAEVFGREMSQLLVGMVEDRPVDEAGRGN